MHKPQKALALIGHGIQRRWRECRREIGLTVAGGDNLVLSRERRLGHTPEALGCGHWPAGRRAKQRQETSKTRELAMH